MKNKKYMIIGSISLIGLVIVWYFRKQIKKTIVMATEKLTPFNKKLRDIAVSEWEYWGKGKIKEGNSKTMQRLRDYWIQGAKVKGWTDQQMTDLAWSSAFISYVMMKAGAVDFKYSPSHSTYITDAIKNRKENNSKKIKAYRPSEVNIAIGDIVSKPRQNGVTYDTTGGYLSHSDIVTYVDTDYAEMIGGNVGNSVSVTILPLKDGKIDPVKGSKYFSVIKNTI